MSIESDAESSGRTGFLLQWKTGQHKILAREVTSVAQRDPLEGPNLPRLYESRPGSGFGEHSKRRDPGGDVIL